MRDQEKDGVERFKVTTAVGSPKSGTEPRKFKVADHQAGKLWREKR